MEEKDNSHSADTLTLEERRRYMLRDLYFRDPRRLMITRAEVEELGLEYDGELYEPK